MLGASDRSAQMRAVWGSNRLLGVDFFVTRFLRILETG